jgi:predicted 2-oxoglutarate/Fe(II)-dependent dioxygenase YbiX
MFNTFEHNGIVIYRNFINNPDEMLQYILAAEVESETIKWERAKVVKPEGNEEDEWRTNELLHLRKKESLTEEELKNNGTVGLAGVYAQIHSIFLQCLYNYMERFNFSLKDSLDQGYQILKYSDGGEYKRHMDDGIKTPRRVSGLLYLNGNFEGGELEFPYLNFTYKPYGGDLLLFPSGVPYMHVAKPVTTGTKYSVVSWWF